jgi:DNA polymerase-3 subunit epsilon
MNWFKSHKDYPEFYKNYKASFRQGPQDLNQTRFVVFDTETTGLNPKTDRILSIGTIAIKAFQIDVSDHLECYLKQDVFNAETVEIHGLLKEGRITKIEEKEAIKLFLNHIENAILVAHHIAFDLAMINEALKRMDLPKLKNRVIDTGQLYKKTKYIKDHKHYSLDQLCKGFNIKMHDRHTASGDAFLTAVLFLKLSALLRKKKKHLKLKDFFNWI